MHSLVVSVDCTLLIVTLLKHHKDAILAEPEGIEQHIQEQAEKDAQRQAHAQAGRDKGSLGLSHSLSADSTQTNTTQTQTQTQAHTGAFMNVGFSSGEQEDYHYVKLADDDSHDQPAKPRARGGSRSQQQQTAPLPKTQPDPIPGLSLSAGAEHKRDPLGKPRPVSIVVHSPVVRCCAAPAAQDMPHEHQQEQPQEPWGFDWKPRFASSGFCEWSVICEPVDKENPPTELLPELR